MKRERTETVVYTIGRQRNVAGRKRANTSGETSRSTSHRTGKLYGARNRLGPIFFLFPLSLCPSLSLPFSPTFQPSLSSPFPPFPPFPPFYSLFLFFYPTTSRIYPTRFIYSYHCETKIYAITSLLYVCSRQKQNEIFART